MKKALLPLFFAAALLSACHSDRLPDGILDHQQMVDFLTDAYLIEGYCAIETRYNFDSLTPEMLYAYDEILAEQGITREQVEASLVYYAEHPDKYLSIHEDVAEALNEEKEESVSVDL